MIQHYLQLLRHYRRGIFAIIAVMTAAAVLIGIVGLSVSPKYTASASVVVMPTEAEYTFGRESSGGPRNTARGLTATYIEYLKSRPVVEAAFEKVKAKMAAGSTAADAGGLAGFVKQVRGTAAWLYHVLDSGTYLPLPPREAAIQEFTESISLQTVADSYILKVEVTLKDPKTAAEAANALAEAYVQRVSQELATSVGQIGEFLREQIALREKELEALRATEERLKAGVGSSSLEEERDSLVRARETERQKLMDAQTQLDAAKADLDVLENQDMATSGRSLADLSVARAAAISRREAAMKNVEMRQRGIRDLSATLEVLKQKEEPLLSVQRRLEMVKEDLAQLNTRMLSTDLTRSTALTQVRLIDPAVAPTYPSSPRVLVNAALGLIAGLLVGLMLLVLVDTLSESVKTTADLERVTAHRSLGLIPRRLLTNSVEGRISRRLGVRRRLRALAGGLEQFARQRGAAQFVSRVTDQAASISAWHRLEQKARLRVLGADLERRLTMVSAFDTMPLQVTGFLDHRELASVTVSIAAALASQGRRVVCRLPDNVPTPETVSAVEGDNLVFGADETPDLLHHVIRIKCLAPVSADLSLARAADRSRTLICLVPVGEVPERDVENFQRRALDAGLSALSFGLLAS
jgi:uncharacterized protein involved in exopolysaccharide biosynthesis